MGYYTTHELHTLPEEDEEKVRRYIRLHHDADPDYCYGIDTDDSCKWYSHREDMLDLSSVFPNTVLVLDGDGEKSGDIWREFYRNGKTYRWELKVERPEFSQEMMDNVT